MQRLTSPSGIRVSYDRYGSGPPLVLVHGAFSDHVTNWEFVKPLLAAQFTVYAVARRGRGLTDATEGHRIEDERDDVVAVIRTIGEPVFLLGHSYGAQVALAAAAGIPERVRKLVLYEPAWPSLVAEHALKPLASYAQTGDWDGFSRCFFHDVLTVPMHELEALRATDLWAPIIADAPASLRDLLALSKYDFDPMRFRGLRAPVMLQIGSESPRSLYVTDALAAALPNCRIGELPGQAHEGMTTAPAMYAEQVIEFCLERRGA